MNNLISKFNKIIYLNATKQTNKINCIFYSTTTIKNNNNNNNISNNQNKKVEITKENQQLLQDLEEDFDEEEFKPYVNPITKEIGGPRGPEPTRYNDWERNGRVSDF
ncbi:hypothetical protein ACTA71_005595 [Dictyostelium dimigraforme]